MIIIAEDFHPKLPWDNGVCMIPFACFTVMRHRSLCINLGLLGLFVILLFCLSATKS